MCWTLKVMRLSFGSRRIDGAPASVPLVVIKEIGNGMFTGLEKHIGTTSGTLAAAQRKTGSGYLDKRG
jgi:hypothetical protein